MVSVLCLFSLSLPLLGPSYQNETAAARFQWRQEKNGFIYNLPTVKMSNLILFHFIQFQFLQFLTEIEATDESRIFGFDAEFFSAETCNDRVSIVQVATRSVVWQESWLK